MPLDHATAPDQTVITTEATVNQKTLHDLILQLPVIPVSWGELIDKISILELKAVRLSNHEAIAHVHRELGVLREHWASLPNAERVAGEIAALRDVNRRLWDVEEALRHHEMQQTFDAAFIELARSVYKLNDERAALKRAINVRMHSVFVEEKSYPKPK